MISRSRSTFSVIMPVYREETIINAQIDHIRQLTGSEHVEIIIVDGCPEKGTIKIIRSNDIRMLSSPPGRAVQMNKGAAQATGDILVFLHADTRMPPGAFALIKATLGNDQYIGGAFDLGIDSGKYALKVIAFFASLRSRCTRIPYGDQALFIRKDIFRQLGGFAEIPLMEDVEIMKRVKRSGFKIQIIPHKVLTSARRWYREGIIRCTARNWAASFLYRMGVPLHVLVRWYRT